KFRISHTISILLQSDIHYAFSDYLDDVSGKYKSFYNNQLSAYAAHPGTNIIPTNRNRGYDDGINDFYIFNKAAIQINLGSKKSKFKAPILYTPNPETPYFYKTQPISKKDIPASTLKKNPSNN